MNTIRNHNAFFLAILVLITAGIYARALSGEFVWDDRLYILQNPSIGDGRAVLRNFVTPQLSYRPLFFGSLHLDYKMWGMDSRGYHLTSLLLYLATVLLVFGIASRFWREKWPAFWTALLFAVHPLHAETVGWVSARSDLICGLFFLLSIYLYLVCRQTSGASRGTAYIASLAGFILALASKEMALVLPFVIWATHYWFPYADEKPGYTKRTSTLIIPYFVLTAAFLVWRLTGLEQVLPSDQQNPTAAAGLLAGLSPEMIGTVSYVTLQYLRLLALPFSLRAVYDLPPVSGFFDPVSLWALGGIGVLGSAVGLLYRHSKPLFWAAVWTLLTMIPAYLVILIRNNTVMAERYLFLASVGFCFLIVGITVEFYRRRLTESPRWLKRAYPGLGVVVAAVFVLVSLQRIAVWKDEKTLWLDTVEKSPRSSLVRTNLGKAYLKEGRLDRAAAEFQAALAMNPNNRAAHVALANLYHRLGKMESAVKEYEAAVRTIPDPSRARSILGQIYLDEGRTDWAVKEFQKALDLKPDFVEARLNLGVAYHALGHYGLAVEEYRKIQDEAVVFPVVYYNLGLSLWRLGEREQAVASFRRFADNASPAYESYKQSARSYIMKSQAP